MRGIRGASLGHGLRGDWKRVDQLFRQSYAGELHVDQQRYADRCDGDSGGCVACGFPERSSGCGYEYGGCECAQQQQFYTEQDEGRILGGPDGIFGAGF